MKLATQQLHLAANSTIVGMSSTTTRAGPPAGVQHHLNQEPLVDADVAGEFLCCSPLTVKRMAHKGFLPRIAFPIGRTGKFRYRFKLSQLHEYVESLSRPAAA